MAHTRDLTKTRVIDCYAARLHSALADQTPAGVDQHHITAIDRPTARDESSARHGTA
ncbi:hypothetical protein ACOI1H_07310 [Loktanella sp. DJP18]|uniref:hypothetical protein n=1 Tax=Loktanella sp. DJP18 TaxID=3409788 RepID=UPI003BB49515